MLHCLSGLHRQVWSRQDGEWGLMFDKAILEGVLFDHHVTFSHSVDPRMVLRRFRWCCAVLQGHHSPCTWALRWPISLREVWVCLGLVLVTPRSVAC